MLVCLLAGSRELNLPAESGTLPRRLDVLARGAGLGVEHGGSAPCDGAGTPRANLPAESGTLLHRLDGLARLAMLHCTVRPCLCLDPLCATLRGDIRALRFTLR